MLCAMPLELQLSIADAVDERRDRAALALASPRLGLAACRQLPSYQGLEMSLAFYLVLGGAIDERLLRGYASRSEATPEGCKRLAAVAGLQISRSAGGRRSGAAGGIAGLESQGPSQVGRPLLLCIRSA